MSTPTYCTSCGHELGVGRFCTNCGKPVPGRHPEAAPGTSAPPATGPVVPPPVGQLPPSARYPLFADAPERAPEATATRVTPVPAYPPPPAPPSSERRRRAWLPWVVAVVLLALVAGAGAVLLTGGGDDDKAADERPSGTTSTPTDAPSSGTPDQPDATGTEGPVEAPDPDDVVDLTPDATAQVPTEAPPSRDRAGKQVRFVAANMWDGKPRTAWRMPGDGTGQTLTFDLGQDVVITEVGLINGYAKVDGSDNWYQGNRRIRAVQWEFDDGTRVTQELADRREVQRAELGPIATRTVTVHLLVVTAPGKGPNSRDFTAISELQLLGAPAS
ncbi:NADase-type glycan-binding domain-containing protein [Nocardioides sp. LML1-1-1.1]|uniref:NADase-type glycan-binding domain-containing protein n=1 Tax=Nocardioides sp. LML1-1-1.1 TaxID=3135248 RepID=UPI00342FEF02